MNQGCGTPFLQTTACTDPMTGFPKVYLQETHTSTRENERWRRADDHQIEVIEQFFSYVCSLSTNLHCRFLVQDADHTGQVNCYFKLWQNWSAGKQKWFNSKTVKQWDLRLRVLQTEFLDVEAVVYLLPFVRCRGDRVDSLCGLRDDGVGEVKDATSDCSVQPLGDAICVWILRRPSVLGFKDVSLIWWWNMNIKK